MEFTIMQENSGLIFSADPRDKDFAFSKILIGSRPPIKRKEWWADGWWGNQGNTPHCCAYSWVHVLEDGPVIQDIVNGRPKPMFAPDKYYRECKKLDGLPKNSEGTTIRAGAKVAQNLRLISEYRWANSIDEMVDALLIFGPIIAGTHWYSGMNSYNSNGLMNVSGRNLGGHAYVINGVDTDRELFRVKNSYGKSWGKDGYGYISFSDFDTLLDRGADICIPFELKLDYIPQI